MKYGQLAHPARPRGGNGPLFLGPDDQQLSERRPFQNVPPGSSSKKPPLPLGHASSSGLLQSDSYLNFNERVRHLENANALSDAESESKVKIRIT